MIKILILGAAKDQLSLIESAKDLGYYVVCCDRTTTNPGLALVDKHYQVNYMDREAVMEIARKEEIDGVISNSEPVMENVAYISSQLGLRGNSVESIRDLGEKDRFRKLQKRCGVYAPQQRDVATVEEVIEAVGSMQLPVIIKSCRNSASRGLYRIDTFDEALIAEKFEACSESSWNGKVSVEEFVEMPSLRVIEGDIFVYDGKILYDGLFNNYRSGYAPMIPSHDVSPLTIDAESFAIVKDTMEKIVNASGLEFGQFNVEMYFTKHHELFVIEVNTRQGGVGVPAYIKQYSGIDYSRLLVSLSVNDYSYADEIENHKFLTPKYVISMQVFNRKKGVFEDIFISEDIRPYVQRVTPFVTKGEQIDVSANGAEAIGNVNLEFPTIELEHFYAENIERYIYPLIREE